MMMLAELGVAYAAVKAAGEIGRAVLAADKQLSEADLKLRLADMMGSLAEARMSLATVQEAVDARDAEIARLKEALETRTRVQKLRNAYYELDDEGRPVGYPFCMHCYESNHMLRHIIQPKHFSEEGYCPACKSKYPGRTIQVIRDEE